MKVFYSPHMSISTVKSFSPSAGKPAEVVRDWLDRELIEQTDVMGFLPAVDADLALAHRPAYVKAIMSGKERNGFGNTSLEVAHSLRYTIGSMIAAAEHACVHKTAVCSPSSGFHHAGYDHAGGFCTFNGLMVAARMMQREGLARRVLIIDADAHYGDGTDDIIDRQGYDGSIMNITVGGVIADRVGAGEGGQCYLQYLQEEVGRVVHRYDLVLYQAGADPHIRDPLGGILTTEEMLERDRLVFSLCKGKPLVWNLAGGYQRDANGSIEPVLELHRNTVQAFKETYEQHLAA